MSAVWDENASLHGAEMKYKSPAMLWVSIYYAPDFYPKLKDRLKSFPCIEPAQIWTTCGLPSIKIVQILLFLNIFLVKTLVYIHLGA